MKFIIPFLFALGLCSGDGLLGGLLPGLNTLTCLPCTLKKCSGSTSVPVSLDACGIAGGMGVPGPESRGDCFPSWMNTTKFKAGQQFFSAHVGKIGLDETFSIVGLLAIPQMTDVLLFTATNDCPFQAEKRYPTTTGNIVLWAQATIDTPGSPCAIVTSIKKVRDVHTHAADRVRRVTTAQGSLGNEARFSSSPISDSFWDAFHLDLGNYYSPEQLEYPDCYTDALSTYVPLNQFQYAMTQWSFNAMLSISVERSLIPDATDADVEAFNHFWGVVGHMMGIDDNYNIALQPNAAGLRNITQDILAKFVIPSLYNISHVSKYFMELTASRASGAPVDNILGFPIPSPVTVDILLLGICRIILNIPCPSLYAAATPIAQGVSDGLAVVINTGVPPPLVIDTLLNTLVTTVLTYWGNKYYGLCYDGWLTECQTANNMHYLYSGPDVNPDGINSTAGYCTTYPPLLC